MAQPMILRDAWASTSAQNNFRGVEVLGKGFGGNVAIFCPGPNLYGTALRLVESRLVYRQLLVQ